MNSWNQKLRTGLKSSASTLLVITLTFSMLKSSGPWDVVGDLPALDSHPHSGVAHFIAPKPDNDDVPYNFQQHCWALKVVPELKKETIPHLWRTVDLSRRVMEAFITQFFHRSLHADALSTLRMALPWAEKYCLDPLWVASLIFVESGFNTARRSSKNAFGAAQLIPETGRLMSRKLLGVVDPGLSSLLVKTPETNIRMGLYYLARLMNFFSGNYEHATVAYNMGPWWVKNRLKKGPYSGQGHSYFIKIHTRYVMLMNGYLNWVMSTPPEYESSYVVIRHFEGGLQQLALNYARNVESFLAYIDRILGVEQKTLLAEIESPFLL